jgi:autotransporter-associated beta strand protein
VFFNGGTMVTANDLLTITTAVDAVRINGPVTLQTDVRIDTDVAAASGLEVGNVLFTNDAPLDSADDEANDLVIDAGAAAVWFNEDIGHARAGSELGHLEVERADAEVVFGQRDTEPATVEPLDDPGPVNFVELIGSHSLYLGSRVAIGGRGITFNGGDAAETLLIDVPNGAILIHGSVTLGSTTALQHKGIGSLYIHGGRLDITAAASRLIDNDLTPSETATLDDAHPSGTIESQITGLGRLVKTGPGWLKLTNLGDNTYEGGTTISSGITVDGTTTTTGGTLSISKDRHLGRLVNITTNSPVPDNIVINDAALYVRSNIPNGLQGTVGTAGSDTAGRDTIQLDVTASTVDDAYNGSWIHITKETGKGQVRKIIDYVGATRTATLGALAKEDGGVLDFKSVNGNVVAPKWDVPPETGSPYEIMPTYEFVLHGNRGIQLGSTSGTGHGTIFVGDQVMVTYNGVVANEGSSDGSLVKTGGGTLMLNGASTYTGPTFISEGTLLINGSTTETSTVFVGGERLSGSDLIAGEPVHVTGKFAVLGGVGVVQGNVYVLGIPAVSEKWALKPPGGHVNPGSASAGWIITTNTDDASKVQVWGLPSLPGILTTGPIEFMANSYLTLDFGNGGAVDPTTGRGKGSGYPYPGGDKQWEIDFAAWQEETSPNRSLPPVDRVGYDQLLIDGNLTVNQGILEPNLQFIPLAWEAQFVITDFVGEGEGQTVGSLFQDKTIVIQNKVYLLRYDRGMGKSGIAFESTGFTPGFRPVEAARAPVLVLAKGAGVVEPPALRAVSQATPPPMVKTAAGGEVGSETERLVEVRLVTPTDDAGGVAETKVLELPVSVLRDLRALVSSLPDDRYRVYLVIKHGKERSAEEFMVRELYVREGKPVDRDESQQKTKRPAAGDPVPGETQVEPKAEDAMSAPGNANSGAAGTAPAPAAGTAPAASNVDGTAPAPVTPLPDSAASEAGDGAGLDDQQQDGLLPAGVVAGSAAALWQSRVAEAIARHAPRLPSKAVRLCRRKRTPK